jgi:hypothetical protein
MSIGGVDTVLKSPGSLPVTEVVLRLCRLRWPNFVFQDEGETQTRTLDDPALWLNLTASQEFFVFRDRAAADRWDEAGFDPTDPNSMLYFLVGELDDSKPPSREVTLVCGELTNEIREFIAQFEQALEFFASAPPIFKEAA